jgi:4a-hydroxytetrahydrobiopterin dehydratase
VRCGGARRDRAGRLADWQRDGDTLVRTAKLSSFPPAIEAVRAVAEIAEARKSELT